MKVIKWLGIAVLAALVGIILFFGYHYLTIAIVESPYKKYDSKNSTPTVIASEVRLEITNQYHIAGWGYNNYGLVDVVWSTKEKINYKVIWLYKIEKVIPSSVLDIPIEQRITNDVELRDSFAENIPMNETSYDIPLREGYSYICDLKYDKKIRVLSSFMHGEILKDVKEETERYKYRLIYANQRKLAFCEDAKDLRKGVLYFYFQRRGFVNTDIAIVQMKSEPENLYFVYAFDEYAGKNHEAIRNFLKDYFDIRVKE